MLTARTVQCCFLCAFTSRQGWIAARRLGRGVEIGLPHNAPSCTSEHSVKQQYLNSANNKDECAGSDLQEVDMPEQC